MVYFFAGGFSLEFQTTYVWFIRVLPKMAGLG